MGIPHHIGNERHWVRLHVVAPEVPWSAVLVVDTQSWEAPVVGSAVPELGVRRSRRSVGEELRDGALPCGQLHERTPLVLGAQVGLAPASAGGALGGQICQLPRQPLPAHSLLGSSLRDRGVRIRRKFCQVDDRVVVGIDPPDLCPGFCGGERVNSSAPSVGKLERVQFELEPEEVQCCDLAVMVLVNCSKCLLGCLEHVTWNAFVRLEIGMS
mmetsp:Transcript_9110/g.25479  ORF Transcript_9110/g.25479 Transcript_9110/m.25479 type:complete len:213 (+) Transcript_9110:922-1560(+)